MDTVSFSFCDDVAACLLKSHLGSIGELRKLPRKWGHAAEEHYEKRIQGWVNFTKLGNPLRPEIITTSRGGMVELDPNQAACIFNPKYLVIIDVAGHVPGEVPAPCSSKELLQFLDFVVPHLVNPIPFRLIARCELSREEKDYFELILERLRFIPKFHTISISNFDKAGENFLATQVDLNLVKVIRLKDDYDESILPVLNKFVRSSSFEQLEAPFLDFDMDLFEAFFQRYCTGQLDGKNDCSIEFRDFPFNQDVVDNYRKDLQVEGGELRWKSDQSAHFLSLSRNDSLRVHLL
ncbi:hypothetical protein QR680_013827 [Steinernema hermaphroditum]|uniref:Uncharacterized protein n=1 Tax=Steinernema hermaphroditum TaxID=289476 RepID=A0AA39I6T8_9BILA|nr:hypothetical protein QR680_013827 [Steinernema hermaphroditum]